MVSKMRNVTPVYRDNSGQFDDDLGLDLILKKMPSCSMHSEMTPRLLVLLPRLISEPLASVAGMPRNTYRKPASPSKRRASRSSRADAKGNRSRWEQLKTAEVLGDARWSVHFITSLCSWSKKPQRWHSLVFLERGDLQSFLLSWKWSHSSLKDGCDPSSVNLHRSPAPSPACHSVCRCSVAPL